MHTSNAHGSAKHASLGLTFWRGGVPSSLRASRSAWHALLRPPRHHWSSCQCINPPASLHRDQRPTRTGYMAIPTKSRRREPGTYGDSAAHEYNTCHVRGVLHAGAMSPACTGPLPSAHIAAREGRTRRRARANRPALCADGARMPNVRPVQHHATDTRAYWRVAHLSRLFLFSFFPIAERSPNP